MASADKKAPKISSAELSDYTIDLSAGSLVLESIVRFSDDLSGVVGYNEFWRSPNGRTSLFIGNELDIIEGNSRLGTLSVTGTLDRFSQKGLWNLDGIEIFDAAGNTRFYRTPELKDLGLRTSFEVVSGTSDTRAPKLKSLSLSSYDISLSSGSVNIATTIEGTDDLSGLSFAGSSWRSPDGQRTFFAGGSDLISGNLLNGTLQGENTLDKFSQPGTWTLEEAFIQDKANNFRSYRTDELEELGIRTTLNVSGGEADITAPRLASLDLLSYSVNVASGNATIKATVRLTDDISGVEFYSASWSSPSGRQFVSVFSDGAPTSGSIFNGSFSSETQLSQTPVELGTWIINGVDVQDRAGNFRFYAKDELEDLGIRTTFDVTSAPVATPTNPKPRPVRPGGGRIVAKRESRPEGPGSGILLTPTFPNVNETGPLQTLFGTSNYFDSAGF